MPELLAERALVGHEIASRVRIEIDGRGDIVGVARDAAEAGGEPVRGLVLPGMPNLHGHAFQRAMAGLAERLEPGEASFWTWRDVMYRFLARLTPDDVRAIAAQVQVEMLEAGYTSLGEFHYLHHAPGGRPYDEPAAMSAAILDARRTSGIGLTLLPVLYTSGGFGGAPPAEGQRRFLHDLDGFGRLLAWTADATRDDPDLAFGIAPHSLRAVTDDELVQAVALLDALDPAAPVHIHVAEQAREVRDCLAWCGRRPVEHLLDVAEVGPRWCLIHATHMDEEETVRLARSAAVAGLCPTTEANLGDGLFNLPEFLSAGGRFGIGSDSHVGVSPIEELRWLEYGQRLGALRRLVAADERQPHTGARLWRAALEGGAQALGRPVGRIAPGARADLVVIDDDLPALAAARGEAVLDALVFSGNQNPVRRVMVGGRWRVADGRHAAREVVGEAYQRVVRRLV
ncbi:MAG TPA: formimidoylglutamate deiminase [Geminicoccaceae bacterium]